MPEESKINLLTILDEINELVYVADVENHEVLYVNEAGKKQFGIEEIPKGIKCFQLFQGLEEPCPFCNLPALYGNRGYLWEQKSPVTGRIYILKDYLVTWEGRSARLEIAFDMTAARKEERALKCALEGEKLVLRCVKILYEEKDQDRAIQTVLTMVGEFLRADRACIVQCREEKIENIYKWRAEGVKPFQGGLQELPFSKPESWEARFRKRECVIVRDIEEIRDEGQLFLFLKRGHMKSLVLAPLERCGEITGYFAVINPPPDKIDNSQSMLETLRYFIMLTFQKKADEELLEHMSCHDMLTGLYNRNKYIMDIENFSRWREPYGIVYLDVNGLKEINDHYGHSSGDKLLVSCAEKMRRIFRNANIYRTGGDEFVIVCTKETRERFETLWRQLRGQFAADGPGSVAIGCQWAEEYAEISSQVALADEKMYEDKNRYYEQKRKLTENNEK